MVLYFTIQSNIFVVLFLAMEIYNDFLPGRSFPIRSSVHGAVTLYILITGLVYNLLLAQTWDPQGMVLVINTITHTVVPSLFLLDWILTQEKKSYKFKYVFYWLIYPLLYLGFGSFEGSMTGQFRYFFLDYQHQSPGSYFANLFIVLGAFITVGVLLIGLNRLYPKKLSK